MKRRIIFKLEDNDSFFKLTTDYFSRTGFKKTSQTQNQMTFTKGSILLNMVTFNPLNWKSEIKVTLQNDTVVANFDINAFGQLATPKEEKLWDIFVENYKVSVTNKLDLTTENQRHLKETKRDSLGYVKWALMGAVVFGVPFNFLAYLAGIDTLALMGGAIGTFSFMIFKLERERKRTSKN